MAHTTPITAAYLISDIHFSLPPTASCCCSVFLWTLCLFGYWFVGMAWGNPFRWSTWPTWPYRIYFSRFPCPFGLSTLPQVNGSWETFYAWFQGPSLPSTSTPAPCSSRSSAWTGCWPWCIHWDLDSCGRYRWPGCFVWSCGWSSLDWQCQQP